MVVARVSTGLWLARSSQIKFRPSLWINCSESLSDLQMAAQWLERVVKKSGPVLATTNNQLTEKKANF